LGVKKEAKLGDNGGLGDWEERLLHEICASELEAEEISWDLLQSLPNRHVPRAKWTQIVFIDNGGSRGNSRKFSRQVNQAIIELLPSGGAEFNEIKIIWSGRLIVSRRS
jgi:hypothetical protein